MEHCILFVFLNQINAVTYKICAFKKKENLKSYIKIYKFVFCTTKNSQHLLHIYFILFYLYMYFQNIQHT